MRPFSYLKTALFFGTALWYYDHWRRVAVEYNLGAAERYMKFQRMKAMNSHRYGEEEDIPNLVEYVVNQTIRE